MVSEIIQKEKARQNYLLKNEQELKSHLTACISASAIGQHKKSLINLKKCMEGRSSYVDWLLNEEHMDDKDCFPEWGKKHLLSDQEEIKEDIKELNKMIAVYK